MCAKREYRDVLQPVADLHEEFDRDGINVLPELAWAGAATYYAVLENV